MTESPKVKDFEANPADIFVIWCQHHFPEWLKKKGRIKRVSWGIYVHVGEGGKVKAKLAENRLHLNCVQTSHKAQRIGQ